MRSSYNPIGRYIREVDERNKGLKVQQLLGLSISKKFIPSVANTIGTDMENYKVISYNQFACSTMQVRRDGKMPVAFMKSQQSAIVSQAYPVFEVKDENELLPDYLMLWFSRSEFDREACFHAVGGVRGSLEWQDFLNMHLPVPSIEKQREIVAEYNAIENRIRLNEQLIQKLEETAQAVYREWFVEFEFQAASFLKEYIITNPKIELKKGQVTPYVEMADLSEVSMSIKGSVKRPYHGGSKFRNDDTLLARITPCLENGKTAFVNILEDKEVAAGSTEFIVMRAKENASPYWVYATAKDKDFRSYAISSMVGSSGRQRVHEKYLEDHKIPKVIPERMLAYDKFAKPVFEMVKFKSMENQKLTELKTLLLSRLATAH
jgi:type I restriction enzyme S subunit